MREYDSRPSSVPATIALLSLSSSLHAVLMAEANHAVLETQVSKSSGVLHVPQITALSSVRFVWAC